ncbi:hypothetical protein HRbin30_02536 [bacterium HR30]|nr:hypothetical protein HRbin30_02536 [bacterium HR30]
MRWSLTTAIVIVLAYSVALILVDEFIAKPWRRRRWQQRAARGDAEARALLERARKREPALEE